MVKEAHIPACSVSARKAQMYRVLACALRIHDSAVVLLMFTGDTLQRLMREVETAS